jgi:hypothetical protein
VPDDPGSGALRSTTEWLARQPLTERDAATIEAERKGYLSDW